MSTASARGQCLCGAVAFTAALPSKWVAHCHCTLCQRAHGAAFVTWVGMDSARVAVDALQCNFRLVVVRDACGDRDREAHAANLRDLGLKYGDVMTADAALALLPPG